MNEALNRLDEWAKSSAPLAYIAECLKQVMTNEIAGWVMQENKSAKGLWDYITEQARSQHNKDTEGVLVTPSQMQEYIYAYLRSDVTEQTDDAQVDESPAVAAENQISLIDDILNVDDSDIAGQLSLI